MSLESLEMERAFERARELDGDARAAFVSETCNGDPALRAELESLLQHADAAERFFDCVGGAVRAVVPALDSDAARQFSAGDPSDVSYPVAGLAAADAMVGRTIGRYQVRSLLGRGGMGAVYRAYDERLDREVALKFLPRHLASAPHAAERFLGEARAAAALVHPNVCTVHEIAETEEGQPFIALALYEGETLKQRLRRGPLPPRDAAAIARELACALGVAHAAGIVHRDVKPGNIMLARDGVTRLLDFGLAKVGNASFTPHGVTPGTLAYMSPEQITSAPLDHRSDLWSLGVVLHEMLAGARPFQGADHRAMLQAIISDAPASLDADTPPALRRIVQRLLCKSPADRYPDAAALEADLGKAFLPAVPPETDAVRPWLRTRPRIARLAVVAMLVAVSTSAGIWYRESATATSPSSAPRSLAVLPFVGLGADSGDGYVGDGLSEEITSALGRIDGLRVAARSSAFAMRDAGLDVRRIGDTLGVDAILEGTVRRDGSRLRVTAQLVDARDGLRVWEGTYDREALDVHAVQDEIAQAITGALELRLPTGARASRTSREVNLAAYDLYLRALQLRNDMSSDALQRATDLLDRAIELQPDFSLAYAAKASVIAPRIFYGQVPLDRGVREARTAIDRAFALDPQLAEAHVARGVVQLFFELDWAGAERSLRQAIALNPNDAHAWHHLGNYFRAAGRPTDAATVRLRGITLDPLNARARLALGEDYLYAGRPADARAAFERAAQLDPMHPGFLGLSPYPPVGRARVDLAEGREAEAVEELTRVATLRGATTMDADSLRHAFASGGIRAFWRRWLVFDRQQSGAAIDPLRVAGLSALGGDTATALAALEEASARRHPGLLFLRTEPAFDGLRAHPRYLQVAERMRFPLR